MDPMITADMLASTGIVVKDNELDAYLDHLNEQLNERIGESITESLSDEDVETLAELQEKASDDELGQWLVTHVPNLDEIIQEEIDILLGEATEHSETINKLEES